MKYDKEKLLEALEVKVGDSKTQTIREYLCETLLALWEEGESFSGKRPLGNSDWEIQIEYPLIEKGFTTGKLDRDGYVRCPGNTREFVVRMIKVMCKKPLQ